MFDDETLKIIRECAKDESSFQTLLNVFERNKISDFAKHAERAYETNHIALRHKKNGEIIFASEAVKEILDYAPRELIGRNIGLLARGDKLDEYLERCRSLEEEKSGRIRFETTFTAKNGRKIDVQAMLFKSEDGAGENYALMAFDVTPQKSAEEALRLSMLLYNAVFNSIDEWTHVVDEELRVVVINNAFKKIIAEKISPANAVGMKLNELFPFLPQSVFEEYKYIFSTGKPTFTREANELADGGVQHTETRKTPIFDGTKVVGVVTMIRSVNEQVDYENALKESEERYRRLVDMAGDGLCIVVGFVIEFANSALASMLGCEPGELIGKSFEDFLDPQDVKKIREYYLRHLNGERNLGLFEVKLMTAQGDVRIVEVNASSSMYKGNRAFIVVLRDVTARKAAEDEAAASREKYKILADNSSDLIFTTDLNLQYTYVSPSVYRFRDQNNRKGEEYSPKMALTPQSYERVLKAYAEEMEKERAGGFDPKRVIKLEVEAVRGEGSSIWAEVNATFLRDADGNATGFLGIARDVTAERQSRLELEKSEEKYKQLVELSGDIIYSTDAYGNAIYVNPAAAKVVGYSAEELKGKNYLELVRDDFKETLANFYTEQFVSGTPNTYFEFPAVRKNGETVWLGQRVQLLFKNGKPSGFQAIARDITERKESELILTVQRDLAYKLADANDLKDAFDLILNAAVKLDGVDCGGIYVLDESAQSLSLAASIGVPPEFAAEAGTLSDNALIDNLLAERKPLYLDFGEAARKFNLKEGGATLKAAAAIPVVYGDKLIANLHLASFTLNEFPALTKNAIESLAIQLSGALIKIKTNEAEKKHTENLQNLFDTIDDLIFVIDETGAVIDVNQRAIDTLGFSRDELLGRNFCMMHTGESTDKLAAKMPLILSGELNACSYSLIKKDGSELPAETKAARGKWGARNVVFAISRDNAERKKRDDELKRRDALLNLAVSCLAKMLRTSDMTKTVNEVIAQIGEVYGVDRVYVFKNRWEGNAERLFTSQAYEWVREGISSELANPLMQDMPFELYEDWGTEMLCGRSVSIITSQLEGPKRRLLEAQSTVSCLLVPIFLADEFWGFIGFDDCSKSSDWSETETGVLRIIANGIAGYIKSAELIEKLAHSERRIRAIVDSQRDLLVRTDMSFKITFANEFYCALLGKAPELFVGRPFADLAEDEDEEITSKLLYPPYRAYFEKRVETVKGTRWFGWECYAIKDSAGNPAEIQAVGRDITELIAALNEARESEAKIRGIISAVPDIIFHLGMDGKILDFYAKNEKDLFVAPEVFMGKPFDQILPDKLAAKIWVAMRKSMETGETSTIEYEFVEADESTSWFELRIVCLQIGGYLSIIRNVTEQKRAEEEIRRRLEMERITAEIPSKFIGFDSEKTNQEITATLQRLCKHYKLHYGAVYMISQTGANLSRLTEWYEDKFAHMKDKRPRPSFDLSDYPGFYQAILDKGFFNVPDVSKMPEGQEKKKLSDAGVKSMVCVAMLYDGKIQGIMMFASPTTAVDLLAEDIQLLKLAGEIISNAIARNKAHVVLSESERKYRSIFDNALAGIFRVKTGEWVVVDANKRLAEILGYASVEELLQNYQSDVKLIHPQLDPDDYFDGEDSYPLDDMTEVGGNEIIVQIIQRLYEGKLVNLELAFSVKGGPTIWLLIAMRNVENDEYLEGVAVDITERKNAQVALRHSEARLHEILNSAPIGIVTTDHEGVVESFNPAAMAMFGYDEAEILGRSAAVLAAPRDGASDEEAKKLVAELALETDGKPNYLSCVRKNGERFPVEVSVREILLSGRKLFLALIQDITARRELERMKDEFVSTVSHELRTPITSIRGAIGLLNGGAMGEMPEEMDELIKIANANTERLAALIDDILDIQKIESGKMTLCIDEIKAERVVVETVKMIAGAAKSAGVEIETSSLTQAWVYGDAQRLGQVLSNLLSNAIKFSQPQGKVLVGADETYDGFVRFWVKDYGPGIPKDKIKDLFKKFKQLDSSLSKRVQGSGLGLAISKELVEMHKGRIGCETEFGAGSLFFFEIPAVKN